MHPAKAWFTHRPNFRSSPSPARFMFMFSDVGPLIPDRSRLIAVLGVAVLFSAFAGFGTPAASDASGRKTALGASPSTHQPAGSPPSSATRSALPPTEGGAEDSLAPRVSMLTILPGEAVHTEFGHSAFRVTDPRRGIDRIYNYGTFDFNTPYFIPKFTYGRLNYFLSTTSFEPMMRFYRRVERPVIEQKLNLTSDQVRDLTAFLRENAQPENRTYRYDFLFDNCSTRIRDALASSLGPVIEYGPGPDPRKSFRRLLDPYVSDRPLLDVGFDVGLGLPSDRIASSREVMFLPEYLFWAFEQAQIRSDRGAKPTLRPLVARTDTLLWIDDYNPRESAFPWPLAVLGGLLVVGLIATFRYHRQPPHSHDAASGWDAALFGVAGVMGVVIAFLWFISEHAVTDSNWNVLWAWPTHVVFAIALARGRQGVWMQRYAAGSAVITGILSGGWFFWPQDFHVAIFPLAVLLAVRSASLAHTYRSRVETPAMEH